MHDIVHVYMCTLCQVYISPVLACLKNKLVVCFKLHLIIRGGYMVLFSPIMLFFYAQGILSLLIIKGGDYCQK